MMSAPDLSSLVPFKTIANSVRSCSLNKSLNIFLLLQQTILRFLAFPMLFPLLFTFSCLYLIKIILSFCFLWETFPPLTLSEFELNIWSILEFFVIALVTSSSVRLYMKISGILFLYVNGFSFNCFISLTVLCFAYVFADFLNFIDSFC